MRRISQTFIQTVALILLSGSFAAMAAETEAHAAALEAQCEAAREARLKPLRDAEIAKCKTQQDPAYCERFFRDFGNPIRQPNGTFKPRMFDDLPECVAARKAKNDLKNSR
jgi:hypothetical protein